MCVNRKPNSTKRLDLFTFRFMSRLPSENMLWSKNTNNECIKEQEKCNKSSSATNYRMTGQNNKMTLPGVLDDIDGVVGGVSTETTWTVSGDPSITPVAPLTMGKPESCIEGVRTVVDDKFCTRSPLHRSPRLTVVSWFSLGHGTPAPGVTTLSTSMGVAFWVLTAVADKCSYFPPGPLSLFLAESHLLWLSGGVVLPSFAVSSSLSSIIMVTTFGLCRNCKLGSSCVEWTSASHVIETGALPRVECRLLPRLARLQLVVLRRPCCRRRLERRPSIFLQNIGKFHTNFTQLSHNLFWESITYDNTAVDDRLVFSISSVDIKNIREKTLMW